MRFFIRTTGLIWLALMMCIGLSVLYGKFFPAPLVEWASVTLYLHDTRTGVNYRMLQPQLERNPLPVSGVQVVGSPSNVYQLTVMSNLRGLDIRVNDAEGATINSISGDDERNISNVMWLNDTHVIFLRTVMASGELELSHFNVLTSAEGQIGRFNNSDFMISPERSWVLLNERSGDRADVVNVWDERAYLIHPVSTSFAWSGDGHYFASRAIMDGEPGFQLLDTETGQLLTDTVVPRRVIWSSNNRDLIIHNDYDLVIYRDMQQHFATRIEHPIERVLWSPDGTYAVLLTETLENYQLFLIDLTQENPLQLLTILPLNLQVTSLAWSDNSAVLIYVTNPANLNQSPVYRVGLDGTNRLITRIPSRMRQVRYIETLPQD